MGASKRGTMEALVSKMLFLHLPATHPANFPEIELSPLVQVRGGGPRERKGGGAGALSTSVRTCRRGEWRREGTLLGN